jgi:hypothetical protein
MKPLLTCVCLLAMSAPMSAQFFDSLSAPQVWLRADKSLLSATEWSDVSGNDLHAVALINQTPVAGSLLNFNKTVFFDGIDDYLQLAVNLENAAELTIISVFQSADTTERGVWGTENALARKIRLTTRQAQGPDTTADKYGRYERTAVLNTVSQSWENSSSTSTDAFLAFGSAGRMQPTKAFKGEVAEVMVFARALSFLERRQIETYLAIKYGTSSVGNYISSGRNVLWKAEDNSSYMHRIAGIGRDDAFELYQKQGGNAYDSSFLVISAGSLAAANDLSTAQIQEGNFLIWGDDNGSRNTIHGEGKDSVLSVVERKWMITATGTAISGLQTQLYIDQTRLPDSGEGYWLVVDRSGTGNFSVDNLEYIMPDRITTDGKAVYKVQWDIDGSGKDVFGFARARNLFAVIRKLKDPSCLDETAGRVRIDLIAGRSPYSYTFAGGDNKISREGSITGTSQEEKDLVKGSYAFTLTDSNGDKLVRHVNMVMPDELVIDLGEDQTLPTDTEITLDIQTQVPDSIAVSYLWTSNFGFESEGPTVAIMESGIYTVTVTKHSDGCAFSDAIAISGGDQQRLAVFPTILSPGESCNVSVSMPQAGSVQVQVIDMKGIVPQTLFGENSSEYHFQASLGNAGMYIILIRTPLGLESRRVIVN